MPGGTSEEQECLRTYAKALARATSGVREVVEPLRGLVHADVGLADEVWSRTLKVAWVSFPERRRAEFVGAAGALLAKPWHTKAMNMPAMAQGPHSVSGSGRTAAVSWGFLRGTGWRCCGVRNGVVVGVDAVAGEEGAPRGARVPSEGGGRR